jgi:membrane-associated protease RseP (regulator of RpoE activity)
MDALSTPHCGGLWIRAAARLRRAMAVGVVVSGVAFAAGDTPAPRAFEPGELLIGAPIALPFGRSAAGDAAPASAAQPPADDPRAVLQPPSGGPAVPGSGWLGLAVSESTVPGRWRIEEVATLGPAARAGIAVGDELRAVNGVNLASAADVSQALTGIAAGQDVRVAVARADQVTDIVLRAEPRPPVRPAEPPRFVSAPAAQPAPSPAPASFPSALPAAGPVAPPPAVVRTSAPDQISDPEWQAAAAREPQPVPSRRFGPQPAVADPVAALPSVVAAPTAEAPSSAIPAPATPARGSGRTALGVRTVPIDAATQARFQLSQPAGAYVVGVVQNLPAAKAGVPPGSVIVALGEQPVRSPDELTKLVSSGPLDRPVTVQFVLPGGAAKQTAVVLQALDMPLERALTGDDTTAALPPVLQPALQPAPRRAERPTFDEAAIRSEVRVLRGMLDRLERLLDPTGRRRQ